MTPRPSSNPQDARRNKSPTASLDLASILQGRDVTASAPCRIDCGGALDIKQLAILMERATPMTVTIGLSLRTSVNISAAGRGLVVVDSPTLGHQELPFASLPLSGPFALLNGIIHYFGISGCRLTVDSDVPLGSGLGGSGAAAVATVAAVSKALSLSSNHTPGSKLAIALLAHEIENGVQASLTGLQDQLNAIFGGVNVWIWKYSAFKRPFLRRVLLKGSAIEDLGDRLAVAFAGDERQSGAVSSRYVADYIAGRTRQEWTRICDATRDFAGALNRKDWRCAGRALRTEMAVRDHICPDLWTPQARVLKNKAEHHGCVTRTAGGNRTGSLWAFGEPSAIRLVRKEWGSANLNASISSEGLNVNVYNSMQ